MFQQLLGAGPACPGTGLGLMGQVGTREGPRSRRCRLCAGGAGDVPKEAAGCYDTVCRSNVCAERSQNHLYKRSIPGLGGGRIYLQCLCKAEELQGEDARGNNASLPPGAGAEPGADPLVCMGKGHGSDKGSGSFKQAEPCWISHPTRQICTVKETAGSVQTGARCCLGKQPLLCWARGHLAHGMGRLMGASFARHELKHPEREARSEVSRAPPASSIPVLVEAPQALARPRARRVTFPRGRGPGSAEVAAWFCCAGSRCFSSRGLCRDKEPSWGFSR